MVIKSLYGELRVVSRKKDGRVWYCQKDVLSVLNLVKQDLLPLKYEHPEWFTYQESGDRPEPTTEIGMLLVSQECVDELTFRLSEHNNDERYQDKLRWLANLSRTSHFRNVVGISRMSGEDGERTDFTTVGGAFPRTFVRSHVDSKGVEWVALLDIVRMTLGEDNTAVQPTMGMLTKHLRMNFPEGITYATSVRCNGSKKGYGIIAVSAEGVISSMEKLRQQGQCEWSASVITEWAKAKTKKQEAPAEQETVGFNESESVEDVEINSADEYSVEETETAEQDTPQIKFTNGISIRLTFDRANSVKITFERE